MMNLNVNKINCRYFSRGTQLRLHREEFVNQLPPEERLFPAYIGPNSSVLDLGCGAGRTTGHIRQLTRQVVGVDLSEELISAARERLPEIDFRVMDAVRMDFADNSFDTVVFSYNGLCYLYPEPKRLAAIDEIRRVLKPGGLFIFSSFNRFKPLALYALINLAVTKLLLGFSSRYVIHLTRYGVTVNYETSPEEETALFKSKGFEPVDRADMAERVGIFGYQPAVLTYFVFRKR